MKIPVMIYCVAVVVLSSIASTFAKKFALSGSFSFAIIALMLWAMDGSTRLLILRSGADMGRIWPLLTLPCLMIAVMIGVYYGEQLTVRHYIGAGLGLAAMWCLI